MIVAGSVGAMFLISLIAWSLRQLYLALRRGKAPTEA